MTEIETPPRPSQTSELVLVTPDMAERELTDHNKMNRDINPTDVNTLVLFIDNDEWKANGQTVTYDTDNEIVDGQHRYAAIRKSGKPQWLWIVRGLEPEARLTVDDHRRRTFRDDLSMNGVTGGTNIENVTRKILMWQEFGGIARTKRGGRQGRVMRVQLAECFRKNADSILAALELSRDYPRVPQSYGSRAFLCWLLMQHAPEKTVRNFMSVLGVGSLDPKDAVVVRLRDKFMRDRNPGNTNSNTGRVLTAEHIYFAIRTWNAWVTGEQLRGFTTPAGGMRNPFPTPITVDPS